MILKENDLSESKSAVTVDYFEIEQGVDPFTQENEDGLLKLTLMRKMSE